MDCLGTGCSENGNNMTQPGNPLSNQAIGLIAGFGGLVTLLVIAGIITLIITVLQRHRKAEKGKGIHNIEPPVYKMPSFLQSQLTDNMKANKDTADRSNGAIPTLSPFVRQRESPQSVATATTNVASTATDVAAATSNTTPDTSPIRISVTKCTSLDVETFPNSQAKQRTSISDRPPLALPDRTSSASFFTSSMTPVTAVRSSTIFKWYQILKARLERPQSQSQSMEASGQYVNEGMGPLRNANN